MFRLRLVSLEEPPSLQVELLQSTLGVKVMYTPEPMVRRLGPRAILCRPASPRASSTTRGRSSEKATPSMPVMPRTRSSASKVEVQEVTARRMILKSSRKFSTRYSLIRQGKPGMFSQPDRHTVRRMQDHFLRCGRILRHEYDHYSSRNADCWRSLVRHFGGWEKLPVTHKSPSCHSSWHRWFPGYNGDQRFAPYHSWPW